MEDVDARIVILAQYNLADTCVDLEYKAVGVPLHDGVRIGIYLNHSRKESHVYWRATAPITIVRVSATKKTIRQNQFSV